MTWAYLLLGAVIVLQVVLFVMGRRLRKKERENNVLLKYKINTRQEAWKAMADTQIPEKDRAKIKELYDQED